MAKRWTIAEEKFYYDQLHNLYTIKNLSMREISKELNIGESTVYDRMMRLGISSNPERKHNYLKKRKDIVIPSCHTADLAEFFGIMLGDGNLTKMQIAVTLGTKEMEYASYVAGLFSRIFGPTPKIAIRRSGYRDVYIGSVDIVRWLRKEGLVFNKVKAQVAAPDWIHSSLGFQMRFLRGFFDTDGSVYALRHGIQLSFSNKSAPLLASLHKMLKQLNYKPSRITCDTIYVTHRESVTRFFEEIQPKNPKHQERYKRICVDIQAVKRGRL